MRYNLYTVDIDSAVSEMRKSMERHENAAFFVESLVNFAYVPLSWDWSREGLFLQHGVTPHNMFYDAPDGSGVIIGSPGDLSFLVMRPYDDTKSICDDFESLLGGYMKSKFPNSEFLGNDVLIDGKKAIGTASGILEDSNMTLFMFMASFVDNSELIKILCPPGHTKTPCPIDTSVLTKDEFKSEIVTWLQ